MSKIFLRANLLHGAVLLMASSLVDADQISGDRLMLLSGGGNALDEWQLN